MSQLFQYQLLATKFFVPGAPCPLISRPRLTILLQESLKHPLTLVSAPAGFGKTTLLSSWVQSLSARDSQCAWISLDEEDNSPQLFWTYVLSAFTLLQPERFTPLLTLMQSSQPPPLKYIVRAFINDLTQETQQFVLILDDYHLITEQQVHSTLSYLIEHLPIQLHIILSTRVDPPWSLAQLRARHQVLEIRTDQLCCTAQETKILFRETMGIQLPEETIQQIIARTEGWLVGLQLLGLSLPEQVDPLALLKEVTGDQRYILDYLTEVVLQNQPQEIRIFLLSTCILEQLNVSLCDAVTQQSNSQQMLQRIEQANLFVVALDSKQQRYRYHALFAEALRYQLEQMSGDLMLTLHHRASQWYIQHDQTIQAIVHAFHAKEWQWAADLIESKYFPLMALTQCADEHALLTLRGWVEQLPAEVIYARPRLCLACAILLWQIYPQSAVRSWLQGAEVALRALLSEQIHETISASTLILPERQDREHVLGEVLTWQAFLQSYEDDGQDALPLCQQALALLSPHNSLARLQVGCAQLWAGYCSSENDAEVAIQHFLHAICLNQSSEIIASSVACIGDLAMHMIGVGRLQEGYQLTQQAIELGRLSEERAMSSISLSTIFQADILREWNQLDKASFLLEESIWLLRHKPVIASINDTLFGYEILLRISLSRGDYDAAYSALRQIERISEKMNQHWFHYQHALFTIVDQVRLWLACGELDRAMRWAEHDGLKEHYGSPFAREREEVARARVFLATAQPTQTLQRLGPVLQRATAGKRWGHVIEMRLLQALAYHMCQQIKAALSVLSEAVRLAEPEGYIRSFVDEGAPMATLLSRFRQQHCKDGLTPYLDKLLSAFPQQRKKLKDQPEQVGEHSKVQPLLEPLSERELQVLQLLARGASNHEIAQELIIAVDTAKRHVSHIFSKLGVQNRVKAVVQAKMFGILHEEL